MSAKTKSERRVSHTMNRLLSDSDVLSPIARSTVVMHLNSAIRLAFKSLHHWLAVWPTSSSSVWVDLEFFRKGYLQIHGMSCYLLGLHLLWRLQDCLPLLTSFLFCLICFFSSFSFILVGKSVFTSSTLNSLRFIYLSPQRFTAHSPSGTIPENMLKM